MSNHIQNPKIQQLVGNPPVADRQQKLDNRKSGLSFDEILRQQTDLKVSGHAKTRLQSRGIELGKEGWERVKHGVDRAAAKGSRDSLVMIEDVALVVSVKNRTVITAIGREQLKENVFTNIDSAVFV